MNVSSGFFNRRILSPIVVNQSRETLIEITPVSETNQPYFVASNYHSHPVITGNFSSVINGKIFQLLQIWYFRNTVRLFHPPKHIRKRLNQFSVTQFCNIPVKTSFSDELHAFSTGQKPFEWGCLWFSFQYLSILPTQHLQFPLQKLHETSYGSFLKKRSAPFPFLSEYSQLQFSSGNYFFQK
jgi:hypothetical protein